MVEGSPPRVKEPLPRPERLQDRTLRVRPKEGAGLISERGFEKRQSQLTPQGGAFPSLSGAPSAPPVQLGHFCPRHPADFRERRVEKRMLTEHTCTTFPSPLMSPQRNMEWNRSWWHFIKDEDPLQYSVLLHDLYENVHGYRLQYLDYYTEWIKPRCGATKSSSRGSS